MMEYNFAEDSIIEIKIVYIADITHQGSQQEQNFL